MRLGVSYEDRPFGIHIDAVRARELTFQRIHVRSISGLSSPGNQMNRPALPIDFSNHVVLGIRKVNISLSRSADSFWSGERCLSGRASVAAETFFPCACNPVNHALRQIEFQNCIPLPQSQPEVSRRIKIERAWTTERNFLDRTVASGSFFPSPGKSGDAAGLHVHLANAMIFYITNVEIARSIESDAVWFIQLGPIGRPAISRETGRAIPGNGFHNQGFGVAFSHRRADPFDPVDVSGSIEAYFIGLIQPRRNRRPLVPRPAWFARARNGLNLTVRFHFPNAMVPGVANVKRSIRTASNAGRPVKSSFARRAAISREPRSTRAGEICYGDLVSCKQRRRG